MRDWKIERALRRYAQGGMSFQAAAQQAGVSMADLAFHAYALRDGAGKRADASGGVYLHQIVLSIPPVMSHLHWC